jgi:hypothetical protein
MSAITDRELDDWERIARAARATAMVRLIAEVRRMYAFRDEMHYKVRAIESAMKQHEQNVEALLERPK